MYKTCPIAVLALILAAGCTEPTTPDSNTEVFKTVDQVAAQRRAAQEKNWKQSTVEVLRDERPDITAMPENELVISLFADGQRHRVDLSEVAPALTAQPDQTYVILREYLFKQLVPFDQERLARMSLESVRKRIRPMLVNGTDLQDLTTQLGSQPPTRTIFGDLYWVPVVRWDAPRPATPIGPKALAAWKFAIDEINKLAMANLAADPVEGSFEVTSFGTLGKIGTLRSKTDPAILLSPNFLAVARRELGTSDSLALLLATDDDVRFLPASDKRLLDSIYPNWKHMITNNRKALAKQPLLLSEAGISGLNYAPPVMLIRPTSMPTTNPMQQFMSKRPASRPAKPAGKPYIVR
jgi:hypothetical protein